MRSIDELLGRAVTAGEVPGVAAAVATDRGVVYEAAFGRRTLGGEAAMTPDTVVWLASMSKALTAAAAMQMVERGKLSLDAPAAATVPEIAQAQVLDGFAADGSPRLRPPRRPVTLRHLLTHTAGFGYEFLNADMARYQQATATPGTLTCTLATLRTPAMFDPGERWEYGTGIDWAGRMVERASGQRLGAYLQQHLFAPLGMDSISFKLSPAQRARLAGMHARGADGGLSVMPFEVPQEPEFDLGGGGLYGTAQDYIRFARMIMSGGVLDGERVLQPETVAEMAKAQLGGMDCGRIRTLAPALFNDADFFPGMKVDWGLSFLINLEPSPQGRAAGSLCWAGLPNAFYWIDPRRRVCAVLLTQILPFFDPAAVRLLRDFETAVYRALR